MIYIVCVAISCFALSVSNRCILTLNDKQLNIDFGVIVTILLFSLLTSFRSLDIGTDTINYYYSANSIGNNYNSVLSVFHGYYIEPGYGALELICMKWFGDVHSVFFFEAIILLIGVFSFIHHFEGKISVPLAFFVFFCLYFNTSLNISRQYIAVGIGLFAAKYLLDNKWIRYFVFCIIAMLFHSSGILLFLSFIIWKILESSKSKAAYQRRVFVLGAGIIASCFMIKPITGLMVDLGLLPARYLSLLQFSDSASSALLTVAFNTPLLIMVIVLHERLITYDKNNKIAITLFILGFFVSLLNAFFGNVGRLAVFWTSWQIILYPECCALLKHSIKNRGIQIIVPILIVLYLITYWWYCFVFRQFGETYPYVSDIVSWLNW